MPSIFLKAPDATLDYAFDWREWLEDGESISAYSIKISDTSLVNSNDNQSNGVVTVWLSGGEAGKTYLVTCNITTSYNRTDERTMTIMVEER